MSSSKRNKKMNWNPKTACLMCVLPLGLAAMIFSFTGCGPLLRSTYPPKSWEGEAEGLREPVRITIDTLGIPHVEAANDDDAAFAVGYLHGRDRAFQMELIRLAGQGRLTEFLGADLLDVDRRLRLLTLNVDDAVANLEPVEVRRLESYTAGVNLALKTTPRPFEFGLLHYTPQPWTIRDVVGVARLQAWNLSHDAAKEALREKIRREALDPRVPREIIDWLFMDSGAWGNPIIPSDAPTASTRPSLPALPPPPSGLPLRQSVDCSPECRENNDKALAFAGDAAGGASSGASTLAQAVETWLEGSLGGSNGWAVAGSRTEDGRPILAGDPHLDLRWPPVFEEIHIRTPEIDVSGATFPGLPMIVIGRTPTLAWTVTTSYADTQDLVRLFLGEDADHYLVDGKPEAFIPWEQTFRWGDQEDDVHHETFKLTRFGPVYNAGREDRLPEGSLYALKWPGFSTDNFPIVRPFDKLYRAKTGHAVEEAIEMLPFPSQNWIFALEDGTIGYVLGGQIPERRASPFPLDGSRSDADAGWTTWIDVDERPVLMNPADGLIVATNQSILDDTGRFATYASGTWRALRARLVLETRSDWTPDDMRGLQLDTVNLEAAYILPDLLDMIESSQFELRSTKAQVRLSLMRETLANWSFQMHADLIAPLIYESWRGHVQRRLFGRHIRNAALLDRYLRSRLSEAPFLEALEHPGPEKWDDPETKEVETVEKVVLDAFNDAERELTKKFGADPLEWTWGRAHTLSLEHPFSSKKILKPFFGLRREEASGGRHALFALEHEGVVGDYTVDSGPALRQVAVPGGGAGFVLPGGNAGQSKHEFAINQLPDWWKNRQHPMGVIPRDPDAISGTIRLFPTGSAGD